MPKVAPRSFGRRAEPAKASRELAPRLDPELLRAPLRVDAGAREDLFAHDLAKRPAQHLPAHREREGNEAIDLVVGRDLVADDVTLPPHDFDED